jgi:hypothetical protein
MNSERSFNCLEIGERNTFVTTKAKVINNTASIKKVKSKSNKPPALRRKVIGKFIIYKKLLVNIIKNAGWYNYIPTQLYSLS